MANGGAVYWRIQQLEQGVKKNLADAEKAIERLETKMDEQSAKVDRLTMAIIGFAFTIAASGIAVVFFTGGSA